MFSRQGIIFCMQIFKKFKTPNKGHIFLIRIFLKSKFNFFQCAIEHHAGAGGKVCFKFAEPWDSIKGIEIEDPRLILRQLSSAGQLMSRGLRSLRGQEDQAS